MDWKQIKFETPSDRQLRPQVGRLNELDYVRLIAIAKLTNRSLSGVLLEACLEFIENHWDDAERKLEQTSGMTGKSIEELFSEIVEGK